jgi:hypothetical protein
MLIQSQAIFQAKKKLKAIEQANKGTVLVICLTLTAVLHIAE